jgi:hypothetical protein
MIDETDLEHLESLIEQARSKLAKMAGYLRDDLSEGLQDLLNHVDEFHDELVDQAGADDDDEGRREKAI